MEKELYDLFGTVDSNGHLQVLSARGAPHPTIKSLCDHFSRYFVDKMETIRSKFPDKVQNIPQVQKTEIRSKMNVFERASKD